mmetsp:Transcript_34434/g.106427  ORF Transcript_34434/g.106427 Transcript_34434/m.106427 type:complete len:144 (+) Transcript_34434:166-597(+)
MSAHASTKEDDAAVLHFGAEFPIDECECLSDAEVSTILDNALKSGSEDRPFLRKALEYARRGAGARPTEVLKTEAVHIRQALENLEFPAPAGALHVFEIASLTNLMGKDSEPEEAKALIPSLTRYTDDQLAQVLEAVANAKAA